MKKHYHNIPFYFPEYKLAIEVDEKGHIDRDEEKVKIKKRQKAIEKELDCEFIRINLHTENYNIFIEIGKIHNHIIKSIKRLTKKSTKTKFY